MEKHNYRSNHKSYTESRTGIGGRKKKPPPQKLKSGPTYLDKYKKKAQLNLNSVEIVKFDLYTSPFFYLL